MIKGVIALFVYCSHILYILNIKKSSMKKDL